MTRSIHWMAAPAVVLVAGMLVASAHAEDVVQHATDTTFDSSVGHGVVLVDFWAPWCGPCRKQSPVLDRVAARVAPHARVIKVNIDDYPEIASRYRVESIPTMILFSEGQPVRRFVGLRDESSLASAMQEAVAQQAARETAYHAADPRPATHPVQGTPVAYERMAPMPAGSVAPSATYQTPENDRIYAPYVAPALPQPARAPYHAPSERTHEMPQERWTLLTPLKQLGDALRFWD